MFGKMEHLCADDDFWSLEERMGLLTFLLMKRMKQNSDFSSTLTGQQ
jgi:hypothetical protein